MKIFLIFIYMLMAVVSFSEEIQKGSLLIKINNIKNNDGKVLISICNSEKQFLGKGESISKDKLDIEDNKAIAIFDNVPYGKYAVIVLHDENNNEKMDSNFLKIPKEGYGASNNKIKMGPPNFDKSVFDLNSSLVELEIKMVYIGK